MTAGTSLPLDFFTPSQHGATRDLHGTYTGSRDPNMLGVTGVTETRTRPPETAPPPKGGLSRDPHVRLAAWLAHCRTHNTAITTAPDGPHVIGPDVTDHDHDMARRHAHALTIAATGTHPAWWNHVIGRTDQIPSADQLPLNPSGAYLCTTCGSDADWLDAELLAWCELHVDSQLVAAATAWRAA